MQGDVEQLRIKIYYSYYTKSGCHFENLYFTEASFAVGNTASKILNTNKVRIKPNLQDRSITFPSVL